VQIFIVLLLVLCRIVSVVSILTIIVSEMLVFILNAYTNHGRHTGMGAKVQEEWNL
jgi:hypothetical protein